VKRLELRLGVLFLTLAAWGKAAEEYFYPRAVRLITSSAPPLPPPVPVQVIAPILPPPPRVPLFFVQEGEIARPHADQWTRHEGKA